MKASNTKKKEEKEDPSLIASALLLGLPIATPHLLGEATLRTLPESKVDLVRRSGLYTTPVTHLSNDKGRFEAYAAPLSKLPWVSGFISGRRDGFLTDSIFAHELGHLIARQEGEIYDAGIDYGKGMRANHLITALSGGGLGNMKLREVLNGKKIPSKIRGPVKALGVLGLLGSAIPGRKTILEELSASHQGGKLMFEQTGNPLSYLGPFVGIPSYAPGPSGLAAYYGAKGLTGSLRKMLGGLAGKSLIRAVVSRGRSLG